MTTKEYVTELLETLSDAELQQVAEYLAFLKFRARLYTSRSFDTTEIRALYTEFADEDRALSEEGLAEYSEGLMAEDTR